MQDQYTMFDFQAEVGFTKHVGGFQASLEMIELCQINTESYVLDIGCGVGATPVHMAKQIGCRVVGVDISEAMVARSKERAARAGVAHLTDFRVADVQTLPFKDDQFDAMISESVIVFPEDQQKAVNECVRVAKPAAAIGLNESTWLNTPVPEEVAAWVSQELTLHARLHSEAEWVELMRVAGLQDVIARVRTIDMKAEAPKAIKRYSWAEMFRVWGRSLRIYATDRRARSILKAAKPPQDLFEYFGYGLYVGRK